MLPRQQRIIIHEILDEKFDGEELKTLVFRLGVDYDNLSGGGKASKARELIKSLERQGRLPELVQVGKELRPDISWPDVTPGELPFVIAAMTRQEAEELKNGSCFSDEQERKRFEEFESRLREQGVADWIEQYGEERDDWRPHCCGDGRSIKEVVTEVFQWVASPIKEIEFYSREFFEEDPDTWDKCHPGVVVIDAISLFHPTVKETLKESDVLREVAIVILSPFNTDAMPVTEKIQEHVRGKLKSMAKKFNNFQETKYVLGISNIHSLIHWLQLVLPPIADQITGEGPNKNSVDNFGKAMSYDPMGTDAAVKGQVKGQRR